MFNSHKTFTIFFYLSFFLVSAYILLNASFYLLVQESVFNPSYIFTVILDSFLSLNFY